MMKLIKIEEFLEWVKSQPDDREVNLRDSHSTDQCGCVMIHYAFAFFPPKEYKIICSLSVWEAIGFDGTGFVHRSIAMFEDDKTIDEIIPFSFGLGTDIPSASNIKTYKDLKALV